MVALASKRLITKINHGSEAVSHTCNCLIAPKDDCAWSAALLAAVNPFQ